jgi:hypothetical protein
MSQNIAFKLTTDTNGAVPYVPFTLQPNVSATRKLYLMLDPTTLTTDTSATVSAVAFVQNDASISTDSPAYPDQVITLLRSPGVIYSQEMITFTFDTTGANTYLGAEHTNTITISTFSPWTSGNALSGTSDAFEDITYSDSPMICSFNITFSTANVTPDIVTNLTAAASGSDSSIGLTWTNPTGAGLSGFRINRTASRWPSAGDDGTIVYVERTPSSYLDSQIDIVGGITYCYAVWSKDSDGQYSASAAAVSAVTVNASPSAINSFTGSSTTNGTVDLTWVNPSNTSGVTLSAIQLNYTFGRLPSAIGDGTITTLASSVTSQSITGLDAEEGTYYGFAIYAKDTGSQFSTATYTSAVPVWQSGTRVWASHAEFTRMRLLGYI